MAERVRLDGQTIVALGALVKKVQRTWSAIYSQGSNCAATLSQLSPLLGKLAGKGQADMSESPYNG
jgi:hypothetical protein